MAATAALLGWLVPGAGHWIIGRRRRGVILFATISGLFWSGVAIGGVFTVNPRDELWWNRAQMCTGLSGVICGYRQSRAYSGLVDEATIEGGGAEALSKRTERVDALMADKQLALVYPAAGPARVFSGVAGMLNLLCIIDVFMLGLMGVHGEPPRKPKAEPEDAS